MEEKILIKSKVDEKWRKYLFIALIGVLALSFLFLIGIFVAQTADYIDGRSDIAERYAVNHEQTMFSYSKKSPYGGYYTEYYYSVDELIEDNSFAFEDYQSLGVYLGEHFKYAVAWYIIHWLLLLAAGGFALYYFSISKCELEIGEKEVRGKTVFGKEVTLPVYSILAYTTDKRLSTVGVSTASGVTKFYLLENFKEIADVLSKLIDKEQAIQNSLVTASDSLNQLQQLKQLRDNGVITAEEFETKKKQILGL